MPQAEARRLPLGLKAMERTKEGLPSRVAVFLPVRTSHSLIVLSTLPDASVLPSGLKATRMASSVCPSRVATALPVAASHTLTVLSVLAEASSLPSGLHATELTDLPCPSSVVRVLISWAGSGVAARAAKTTRVNRLCGFMVPPPGDGPIHSTGGGLRWWIRAVSYFRGNRGIA